MAVSIRLVYLTSCVLTFILCTLPSGSNGTATTQMPKTTLHYGGWKPMRTGPVMRSARHTDKWTSRRFLNSSDRATAETTKSFLLVYPPKSGKANEARVPRNSNNNKVFIGPPANTETPLRTYPPTSRHNKNVGNVEGAATRTNTRSKPAGQAPDTLPTSNHHVQIQLLDGYIVPPSQGNQHNQPSITGLQAPIKALPVNFNNVPEIRLLLPGDVHQQLQNLQADHQQPGQQQPIAAKNNNNRPSIGPATHLGESPDNQRPYVGGGGQNYNTYSQPDNVNFPENTRDSRNEWPKPDPDPILDPRAPVNPQDVNGFSQNSDNGDPAAPQTGYTQQQQQQQIQAQGYAYSFSKTTNLNNRPSVLPPQNQNYNPNNQNQYRGRQPGGVYSQPYPDGGQVGQGYSRNNRKTGNNGYVMGNGFRPLGSAYGPQNGQSFGNGYNANQNGQRFGNGNKNGQRFNNGNQNGQRFNNGNQNGIYNGYDNYNQNHYGHVNCPHPHHGSTTTTTTETSDEDVTEEDLNVDERKLGSDEGPTGTSTLSATTDTSTTTDEETTTGTEQTEEGTEGTTSTSDEEAENAEIRAQLRDDTNNAFFVPPSRSSQVASSRTRGAQASSGRSPTFTTQVRDADVMERLTDPGQFQGVNDGGGFDFNTGGGTCDCQSLCSPIQYSPADNMGSNIREIARNLNADAIFNFLGITDDEISTALKMDSGYTLFLPSNEAISRLPTTFLEEWRHPNSHVATALENHVVAGAVPLDQLKLGGRMQSTASGATLFINNYNNEAVTVNGHRIVRGDVTAFDGGIVHVVDGLLCPVADRDLIETLRACGKYDGFLTLADVTKLMDTMQGDGPYTVFLPSNDALTKIPEDELGVLKENVTALKEFLEYHIVEGVYFSEDLKDGQYLSTLLHKQPIRLGVRVDGCFRRLVEVNNSPIFKADIPTKNGVLHIVDWILRPSDLEWCQGVILP